MSDRRKYLGGSDIPAIMGKDKYKKNKSDVVDHKTGKVVPKDISKLPHVRRGIEAEPFARDCINELLDTEFKPIFMPHKDARLAYLGGNVDGYCEKSLQILEIKTTGKKEHLKFLDTKEVPEHHELQLQFYLMLFLSHFPEPQIQKAYDTVRGVYANYRPESKSLGFCYVKPNKNLHDEITRECINIWEQEILKGL